MHLFGKVIVIKRNGTDGAHFPLTARCCVFGRGFDSDIRIQLPTVDTSQCQILIDEKEHVFIQSMSTTSLTLINDRTLSEALTALSHGDIITIVDRKFRFEFPTDSRFYPHKSPKSRSPRTPKRASMTRLSASGEKDSSFSRRLTPVTPLSPRTDNVPASIKSPRSASKVSGQPETAVSGDLFSSPKAGRQSYGSAKKATSPDLVFSLSPAAFYRAPVTPGSSTELDVSSDIPAEVQVNQAFQKSSASAKQKSPGSPYTKTPVNLRKSISDLRRRSVPVFETEEGSVHVQTKVRTQGFATPSVPIGNKRKSIGFDFLSAKRKRVSFGPNLSPEHFDKTLPPKTPIKKGATPSRIIKQERKSLLKAKSPGRKSLSPRAKSPAKVASTPPSSQVFEVSTNTEVFSPEMASPVRSKLQSPKSGLNESESRRSPRSGSENETSTIISPGRKLLPANKRDSQAFVNLNENDSSVMEFFAQEKRLSHDVASSASALAVLSPNTKLVLEKDGSPLSFGNISFGSTQKSATPRSFLVSSTEKKRSVGRPPSRASLSLKSAATPRSNSSFRKSMIPRRSFSASSAERRSVGRPPSRSSLASQSSATPRRSLSALTAERRSVGRPPSRSSLASQSSATPRRSFSVSSVEKRSVGRPPSRSSPSFQSSPTARGFSVSSAEKKSSVGRPPARSKSDSSLRKSVTPIKLGSPSTSVRASLSPKNTPLNTSHEALPNVDTYAKARKLSTSPLLSQDLFSQVSPKDVAEITTSQGRTSLVLKRTELHSTVEVASPIGMKRIFKTPKHKQAANISPSGLKRLMETPMGNHIQISPIGLRNLVKTPGNIVKTPGNLVKTPGNLVKTPGNLVKTPGKRTSNQEVDTPLASKQLLKTPGAKQVSEVSLIGVKEIMKSPRADSSDVSFSGISALFSTPDIVSTQSPSFLSLNSSGKSVPKQSALFNSPNYSLSKRQSHTPKKFLDTLVSVTATEKKRSLGRPPSGKKQPQETPSSEKRPVGRPSSEKRTVGQPTSEKRSVGRPRSEKRPVERQTSEKRPVGRPPSAKKITGMKTSLTEKIISPPQDFKKVVALRAIHGHGLTPKRANFKVLTPKSVKDKASGVFRKTPGKKTWSDIVKSGVPKAVPAKKIELTVIKPVTKRISPKLNKKVHKTPKTPRALARALAPTTGHADSPATIIVGRKFKGTRTPKRLPRKGRKESLSKASRKSAGNTSFTGLTELFTEPANNESTLYADIPDTPDGPNEMFVSPLSNRKSSPSNRKSTNLIGVRELFMKKQRPETNYTGVKELFILPVTAHTVSPSGVGRLMKTPRKRTSGVSPTGVKRLLATPKIKSVPVSPVGVGSLFKTPKLSGDVENVGEAALNKTPRSGKDESFMASTKSGQRGRKRKSEEPLATTSSKKSALAQITPSLSPRSSHKEHQETSLKNKVASPRKTPPGISSPTGGKRQSGVVVESIGSPVGVRGRKGQTQIRQSAVNIESVTVTVGDILSPPKVVPRGRRKAAVIEISTSTVDEILIQLPPKVGARGRQAEIKQSAVNTIELENDGTDTQIISSPKAGPRGRQGKVKIKETVSLVNAQSPPIVGTRGERGQPERKESAVNIEGLKNDGTNKRNKSPPKAGRRGRQDKAEIKAKVVVEKHILSPPKVSTRGRRGKTQQPIETGSIGRRQGRKETKDSVQTQESATLTVEGAGQVSKGRRGRGQNTKSVQSEASLNIVETAVTKARQSKTNVIKPAPAKIASVAVIEKITSPKLATRSGRGKAASVSSTVALDVKTASTRTTASNRQDKAQSVISSLDNASTVAKPAGKRGKAEVVPQVTTSSNSPKPRGGRRNEPSLVTVLPGKSNRRGAKPGSPVSSSDVPQEGKQVGVKRKAAAKSTSVPSKKVKLDSPMPVTPIKPRATRRGQKAGTKSPNRIVISPSQLKKAAGIVDISAPPSTGKRGRPKKSSAATDIVNILATPSSGKQGKPKKNTTVTEAVLIVAPPSTGRRGRPKKSSTATVLATPSSGKQGKPKRNATAAETVDFVAPPSTGKRGRPKKNASVIPAKGRRGQVKNAASSETVDILAPLSTGKKGRPKNTASVIPTSAPKGRKGPRKNPAAAETVDIVAPPSTGKRGRPKKNAAVTVIASVPENTTSASKSPASKRRQGKLKKASAVESVASPATKKRGGPKASLAASGNKGKNKSAGAISDAAKITVATRRRRL